MHPPSNKIFSFVDKKKPCHSSPKDLFKCFILLDRPSYRQDHEFTTWYGKTMIIEAKPIDVFKGNLSKSLAPCLLQQQKHK